MRPGVSVTKKIPVGGKKQITTERCEKNEDLVETGRTGLDRVQSK